MANGMGNLPTTATAPQVLAPRPAFPVQAAPVRHLSHDLPSMPAYDDAWGRPSAWAAF